MFTICRGLCRGLGVRPGGSGWSGRCLKGCWSWKRPGLAASCWLSSTGDVWVWWGVTGEGLSGVVTGSPGIISPRV